MECIFRKILNTKLVLAEITPPEKQFFRWVQALDKKTRLSEALPFHFPVSFVSVSKFSIQGNTNGFHYRIYHFMHSSKYFLILASSTLGAMFWISFSDMVSINCPGTHPCFNFFPNAGIYFPIFCLCPNST